MENQEKQHKRRVRYSGTHPRSYKEKYKEHNPEKYADTIERVIQKGGTPAGMHISLIDVPEKHRFPNTPSQLPSSNETSTSPSQL